MKRLCGCNLVLWLVFLLANTPLVFAGEKGSAVKIELQTRLEPAVWRAREMCDVTISLTLKNVSRQPVTIYPAYTALSWRMSMANMGMSWVLKFVPETPGRNASGHELRTYYGPPGEPVSEAAVLKSGEKLKPGASKQTTLQACWIPRVLLEPASLSLAVLDPGGYDGLKNISNLGQSSVLVFGINSAALKKEIGKNKGFLRGYMVVFFSGAGKYALQAEYRQGPEMCRVVESLAAEAQPVQIAAGEK